LYREGTSYLFAGIPDLGNSIHININGDCNKSVPKSEILIISRIKRVNSRKSSVVRLICITYSGG